MALFSIQNLPKTDQRTLISELIGEKEKKGPNASKERGLHFDGEEGRGLTISLRVVGAWKIRLDGHKRRGLLILCPFLFPLLILFFLRKNTKISVFLVKELYNKENNQKKNKKNSIKNKSQLYL